MTTWNIIEGEAPTWDAVEALGSWDALEALAWQVAGSGASISAGSAAAELVRSAAASGVSSSAGSAAPVRILRPAASGGSSSAGSADAYRTLRAVGTGAAGSAGSAGPIVPLRRAAGSGAAVSAGSSGPVVPLRVAAAVGSSAALGAAAALRVARSRIPPDAVLGTVNMDTGPVSHIRDDPDAPDALGLERVAAGAATGVRVSLETPPGENPLVVGPGRQEFRILVRAR